MDTRQRRRRAAITDAVERSFFLKIRRCRGGDEPSCKVTSAIGKEIFKEESSSLCENKYSIKGLDFSMNATSY